MDTKIPITSLWAKVWKKIISSQDTMMKICFHNMFGVLLDERKEDYRINALITCDSGSGKTEGVRFIEKVLGKIFDSSKISVPASISDISLVGGFDETISKHNLKYGLSADDPPKFIRGKEYPFIDPVIRGSLETKLWIGYDEAEIVLKPTSYGEQIQLFLRKAMDKERRIEVIRKDFERTFKTNTSIILASYELPEIKDTLLTQGLFQRMICYIKKIDDITSKEIENHTIRSEYSDSPKYDFENDDNFHFLIQNLKEIKEWYEDTKDYPIISQSGLEEYVMQLRDKFIESYVLIDTRDEHFSKYKNTNIKPILKSIFRRGIVLIKRLSVHYALIDKRRVITKDDIDLAFELYKECFDSVVRFLLLGSNLVLDELFLLQMALTEELEREDRLPKTELTKRMMKVLGKGETTTINKLNILREKGSSEEVREGNTIFAQLKKD